MLKFSIIIPTYNSAHLLAVAIKSALNQNYPAFEIIVIDDGSDDETKAALEPFMNKIVYLHKTNGGPGSARNLGIRQASGDYIVFLDSDDVLLPWALETYADVITSNDSPAFMLSRTFKFEAEDELKRLPKKPLEISLWDDYIQAAVARYPVTIAAAIRADVLQRHAGFDIFNATSEEQDLFLRIGAEKKFIFINEPKLYAYRSSEGSLTQDLAALEGGLELLLKNEQEGKYGGASRQKERSIILSRIIKYKMGQCLKNGLYLKGCQLYVRSLPYLLRSNRKAAYQLFGFLLRNARGSLVNLRSKLYDVSPG